MNNVVFDDHGLLTSTISLNQSDGSCIIFNPEYGCSSMYGCMGELLWSVDIVPLHVEIVDRVNRDYFLLDTTWKIDDELLYYEGLSVIDTAVMLERVVQSMGVGCFDLGDLVLDALDCFDYHGLCYDISKVDRYKIINVDGAKIWIKN